MLQPVGRMQIASDTANGTTLPSRIMLRAPCRAAQPNLITRLHAVISQPELQVGHYMHKVCMPDTGRDMDASRTCRHDEKGK